MSYGYVGLGDSGGVENCIQGAKLDASKENVQNIAGCAADAYCATYGVPPGLCSKIAGPIVGVIYDFFSGLFGKTYYCDQNAYRPVLINGEPATPCGQCAMGWYTKRYGFNDGMKRYIAACAAYNAKIKADAPAELARAVASALWVDFEKRFQAATDEILDAVPGAYSGWTCNPGYSPPGGTPRSDSAPRMTANAMIANAVAGNARAGFTAAPPTAESLAAAYPDGFPRVCAPKLSAKGNAIYADFRKRVVTSVGRPVLGAGNVPLYNSAYAIDPRAATASNNAAGQILAMGGQIAAIKAKVLQTYHPVVRTLAPLHLVQPGSGVPAWAWLLAIGGTGALGYRLWKRRK